MLVVIRGTVIATWNIPRDNGVEHPAFKTMRKLIGAPTYADAAPIALFDNQAAGLMSALLLVLSLLALGVTYILSRRIGRRHA